jgi:hypothetical protein
MPAPARKTAPSPNKIEVAQASLEAANRQISELHERRTAALLKDDVSSAIELGAVIASRTLEARAFEDRIKLLRAQAEQEERDRKAREREGLIKQIEVKLAERDRAGADLADAIKKMDVSFRRMIDAGIEIQALWNWPASDLVPCLFIPRAISDALAHEAYRVGARPQLGGGQVEPHGRHAGLHLPGGRTPRFELALQPERIPPLTAVLQEASAHAAAIMRGKRSSAPSDTAAPAPVPVMNGRSRTMAEEKLSDLLKQQSVMAEDLSTSDEIYKQLMDQITAAQDAVAAEKAGA